MKILIDLLHPAHYWFFKYFIKQMEAKGHTFVILSRDKDCLLQLLEEEGIKHICLSKQKKGMHNLCLELASRLISTVKIIKKEKPDMLIGCMGAIIAPAGKLTGIPSYVFYENESAKLTNWYVKRLCTKFITPECYEGSVPKSKHVTYHSYQQLSFLHPEYFKPQKNKKHILIRLVSKESSHDAGMGGINHIESLIKVLHSPLIISSEKDKSVSYKRSEFHQVIADSKLVISESPTVCAEAACMGVPSFYISNSSRGFINEISSKYKLIVHQPDQKVVLKTWEDVMNKDYSFEYELLLKDNINVTKWMVDYFTKDVTEVINLK